MNGDMAKERLEPFVRTLRKARPKNGQHIQTCAGTIHQVSSGSRQSVISC